VCDAGPLYPELIGATFREAKIRTYGSALEPEDFSSSTGGLWPGIDHDGGGGGGSGSGSGGGQSKRKSDGAEVGSTAGGTMGAEEATAAAAAAEEMDEEENAAKRRRSSISVSEMKTAAASAHHYQPDGGATAELLQELALIRARFSDRFRVVPDESWGGDGDGGDGCGEMAIGNLTEGCLLWCHVVKRGLPKVPPLAVMVPPGYPRSYPGERPHQLRLELADG
jgi:hypothetical protein